MKIKDPTKLPLEVKWTKPIQPKLPGLPAEVKSREIYLPYKPKLPQI